MTSTALATTTEAKALTSSQMLSGLQAVKNALAPDLSDDELRLFAMVATRSGLDPFARQIFAIKRKGRVTFQTGIDGYRSIAERTGLYDGQDEPEYGPTVDKPFPHPEWATVRVYRKDTARPIAATAYFTEYLPGENQDHMWRKMPRVMIAKVAEALALRKAFPYDPERKRGIGADLYTSDEMAQAERQAPAAAARPSLTERLAAKVEQAETPADGWPADPAEDEVDDVVDGLFTEDRSSALPPDLATLIRDSAAASDLEGPATDEQQGRLNALLLPFGKDVALAGVAALWPDAVADGKLKLTAAQAEALIGVAGSLDDLAGAWAALAGAAPA